MQNLMNHFCTIDESLVLGKGLATSNVAFEVSGNVYIDNGLAIGTSNIDVFNSYDVMLMVVWECLSCM